MSASTRRTLLIFAIALIAAAIVWRIIIEVKSPVSAVCARVNRLGYNISADDLYLEAYGDDICLKELLGDGSHTDDEIQELARLSKACGFDADLEKTGRVELMMYNIDSDRILLIYTVNGEPELVFIEQMSTGSVFSAG